MTAINTVGETNLPPKRAVNVQTIVRGFALVLEGLGIDWQDDPHMKDTPRRAAQAMYDELCSGLYRPYPTMTTFPLEGKRSMIVSKGIPVRSLCAHHLLPFTGTAAVAYIPKDRILGLSKLSRAVEHWARRPQVQETLTERIADFLCDTLSIEKNNFEKDSGVGVVIQSRHFCMELRGVGHSSDVVTSSLRGSFTEPEVRAEFLSLAGVKNG